MFHELFDDVITAKKLRSQGVDGSDGTSAYNEAIENLAFYKVEASVSNGALPADMYKLIGIRKTGSPSERTPFEIVRNNNDAAHILGSNLSTPTEAFPLAVVTNTVELFPTSISKAVMTYYRLPGSVNTDGTFSDLPPIVATTSDGYNGGIVMASGYRDFMIPRAYESELVYEIAKLIGVRLEDQEVTAFASQEEANR